MKPVQEPPVFIVIMPRVDIIEVHTITTKILTVQVVHHIMVITHGGMSRVGAVTILDMIMDPIGMVRVLTHINMVQFILNKKL